MTELVNKSDDGDETVLKGEAAVLKKDKNALWCNAIVNAAYFPLTMVCYLFSNVFLMFF